MGKRIGQKPRHITLLSSTKFTDKTNSIKKVATTFLASAAGLFS
jgi:hypothetical protein